MKELYEESPCDDCPYRQKCAKEDIACDRYVAYFNNRGNWRKMKLSEPSRFGYWRAHSGVRIHDCYSKIGEIKRSSLMNGSLPMMRDIADQIGVDINTASELVAKYKSKQKILRVTVEDLEAEGSCGLPSNSSVDA